MSGNTQPLGAAGGAGGTGGPGLFPGQHPGASPAPTPKAKSRAGVITASVLAAALLGGGAGAGVTALMMQQQPGQANTGSAQEVTITNPENTTAVSAIAEKSMSSVVTLAVATSSQAGAGSGIVISEDGYILTNAHVVSLPSGGEGASIRVTMSDGRILPAQVVGTDPYSDLAVVKVEATGLNPIEFADSSELQVGDLTVAIGAPRNLASTVTSGVISALHRGINVGSTQVPEESTPDGDESPPWQFEFDQQQQQQQQANAGRVSLSVIQTDASINPGNSGGALLNGSGELIGVNVAIASGGTSAATAGSVGLGFAIPSNQAKRVAEDLIAGVTPSHGLLGATVGNASSLADATYSGALLQEIVPNSAAEAAKLRAGDVVTMVDGVHVADGTSLSALVRYHEGGDEVTLTYVRDGKVETAEVTLGTLGE